MEGTMVGLLDNATIGLVIFGWLVSAIASAAFCGKLAFEKDYSKGRWSVLGFFFNWLALLCLVGLPRKDKNFIDLGSDLREIRLLLEKKSPEITMPHSGEEGKNFCPRCGKSCDANDIFCSSCGERLKTPLV